MEKDISDPLPKPNRGRLRFSLRHLLLAGVATCFAAYLVAGDMAVLIPLLGGVCLIGISLQEQPRHTRSTVKILLSVIVYGLLNAVAVLLLAMGAMPGPGAVGLLELFTFVAPPGFCLLWIAIVVRYGFSCVALSGFLMIMGFVFTLNLAALGAALAAS